MSDQTDIEWLNELHAATTPGEWYWRHFSGITPLSTVEPEMTFADWKACCELHNAWPAIETLIADQQKRIATLDEFERRVRKADAMYDPIPAEWGLHHAVKWLDEQRKTTEGVENG